MTDYGLTLSDLGHDMHDNADCNHEMWVIRWAIDHNTLSRDALDISTSISLYIVYESR